MRHRLEKNESSTQQSIASCESNDHGFILQSRRLTGDVSRKGEEWWKICRQDETNSKRSSSIGVETKSKNCTRDECIPKVHPRPQHKERTGDNQKVFIVPNKKAQYSHLVSQARDDHKSPIIYKRPEKNRKEVAPLWFHPLDAG